MRGLGLGAAAMLVVLSACDKKPDATAPVTTAPTTATAAPSGAKDWSQEMAATPAGGFLVGNPDAKVKLVEYASLTCPHCRDFKEEADATLYAKYIAPGLVSYEYRSLLLNGPDTAASLLARCEGPRQFFNLMNAFYAAQTQWTEPFTKLTEADAKQLSALPQDQQIAALAKRGGLDTFMKARGMTSAQFDKCIADPAAFKRLSDMRDAAGKLGVTGTPTFFVNDARQDGIATWAQLEPRLQTALQ